MKFSTKYAFALFVLSAHCGAQSDESSIPARDENQESTISISPVAQAMMPAHVREKLEARRAMIGARIHVNRLRDQVLTELRKNRENTHNLAEFEAAYKEYVEASEYHERNCAKVLSKGANQEDKGLYTACVDLARFLKDHAEIFGWEKKD